MTQWTLESTTRRATAGGLELHFNEAGPADGETVVFRHGSGPGASSRSNFHQDLPAFAERDRCLLVDMPGCGRSDRPEIDKQSFEFAAAMNPENQQGLVRVMSTFAPPRAGELWRELDRIPHPTLMIWGRDDRTLPLDGALLPREEMPDARLHVFPRGAHWAQLEHQAEFDRFAIDFLSYA